MGNVCVRPAHSWFCPTCKGSRQWLSCMGQPMFPGQLLDVAAFSSELLVMFCCAAGLGWADQVCVHLRKWWPDGAALWTIAKVQWPRLKWSRHFQPQMKWMCTTRFLEENHMYLCVSCFYFYVIHLYLMLQERCYSLVAFSLFLLVVLLLLFCFLMLSMAFGFVLSNTFSCNCLSLLLVIFVKLFYSKA